MTLDKSHNKVNFLHEKREKKLFARCVLCPSADRALMWVGQSQLDFCNLSQMPRIWFNEFSWNPGLYSALCVQNENFPFVCSWMWWKTDKFWLRASASTLGIVAQVSKQVQTVHLENSNEFNRVRIEATEMFSVPSESRMITSKVLSFLEKIWHRRWKFWNQSINVEMKFCCFSVANKSSRKEITQIN